MKIEDSGKRTLYKRFMDRTGIGTLRPKPEDRVSKKALDIMRQKPYCGGVMNLARDDMEEKERLDFRLKNY